MLKCLTHKARALHVGRGDQSARSTQAACPTGSTPRAKGSEPGRWGGPTRFWGVVAAGSCWSPARLTPPWLPPRVGISERGYGTAAALFPVLTPPHPL